MTETTISSRQVYAGKILSLRVDRVRLADGAETTREVVDHHGSVAVLAVDAQDRVLLVSQFRYAAGQELWEIPAGRLEPGESPHTAAGRELSEETGTGAADLHPLLTMFATPGYCTEQLWVFLATGLQARPGVPDRDERIVTQWFAGSEAIAMCLDGRIRDAKTIAAVLAYSALRAAPSRNTAPADSAYA